MPHHRSVPFRISLRPVLVGVLMTVTGLASAADLKAALTAADGAFASAFNRGDARAVAALYTADAQILASGAEPVRGTAEIEKFIQGIFGEGVQSVTLTTLEVFAAGDAATVVGRYVMKDKAGKELDHGKYMEYFRREKGAWKLHRDMFNSSVPPAK
jgi:uncharacterized protein (TIGR02246 family)